MNTHLNYFVHDCLSSQVVDEFDEVVWLDAGEHLTLQDQINVLIGVCPRKKEINK